jgi:hypothetical protein
MICFILSVVRQDPQIIRICLTARIRTKCKFWFRTLLIPWDRIQNNINILYCLIFWFKGMDAFGPNLDEFQIEPIFVFELCPCACHICSTLRTHWHYHETRNDRWDWKESRGSMVGGRKRKAHKVQGTVSYKIGNVLKRGPRGRPCTPLLVLTHGAPSTHTHKKNLLQNTLHSRPSRVYILVSRPSSYW